ncbi:hypothetical protein Taro_053621 [Colocasia esculenta]|uniref:Uncharacterized protein n=1 Tax=Colocasia esculenta TaxID=4460 RepID=A0A843XNS0_COLES|nr:hypothetical protein [Colocasia esculenta]
MSFLLKGWPAASGDGARPGGAPLPPKAFLGVSSSVDTQVDCVDTTVLNYSDCFLGQSSSVDTQVDCVDTTGCFSQNMLLGQSTSVDTQIMCEAIKH